MRGIDMGFLYSRVTLAHDCAYRQTFLRHPVAIIMSPTIG